MHSTDTQSTASSLLRRVQQHDAEAWRSFSELYGPVIYGWCRHAGVNQNDAADITQDTLVAVYRSVDKFSPTGSGPFRTWLWTIAHHKICDFQRQRAKGAQAIGGTEMQVQLQQLPFETSESESALASARERQAFMHKALAQVQGDFEPTTWQAFTRTRLEGQDSVSVAAELNLTPNAVRQACFRVLRRLREHLSGLGLDS